jgi:transcriptional regulator with XRE-family HTH domain
MAELDRAAISVRLKQAREEAGLTQPELGDALDPPRHWRTIQNYEDPKLGRVPWDALGQWARVTGKTKEWLLHGDVAPAGSLEELRPLIREAVIDVLREEQFPRLEALEAQVAERAPAEMVAEGFEALQRAIRRLERRLPPRAAEEP